MIRRAGCACNPPATRRWWRSVNDLVPLQANVALLGFDLPARWVLPASSVPVTLYWKALAPIHANLRVFIHLIGPDGQLWGRSDKWNPADFPTSRWPLDRYVRDEHAALLRSDAPAGKYQVIAGLWDGNSGLRMHVLLDDLGQPTAADGILLTEPVYGFALDPVGLRRAAGYNPASSVIVLKEFGRCPKRSRIPSKYQAVMDLKPQQRRGLFQPGVGVLQPEEIRRGRGSVSTVLVSRPELDRRPLWVGPDSERGWRRARCRGRIRGGDQARVAR